MIIYGKEKIETRNKSILTKTKGDHRICMSSVILSLVTGIKAKIKNFETVNTSFPEFISIIKNLGGKIAVK
jgi:5-enolpyruvylshikimate-3-phosphate synthase